MNYQLRECESVEGIFVVPWQNEGDTTENNDKKKRNNNNNKYICIVAPIYLLYIHITHTHKTRGGIIGRKH